MIWATGGRRRPLAAIGPGKNPPQAHAARCNTAKGPGSTFPLLFWVWILG